MIDHKKKSDIIPPVYSRIALDIANRIARGELQENTKLYGRSVMSSEYGVSPETIRRAFALLEEMRVVDIRQNSGVVILSRDKALNFIEKYSDHADTRQLLHRLRKLFERHTAIDKEIIELTKSILDATERYSSTIPFHTYECEIPIGSPVIGNTISGLEFWQKTGATVISVRRSDKILLSPGPYLEILSGDTLILVGDTASRISVLSLLQG